MSPTGIKTRGCFCPRAFTSVGGGDLEPFPERSFGILSQRLHDNSNELVALGASSWEGQGREGGGDDPGEAGREAAVQIQGDTRRLHLGAQQRQVIERAFHSTQALQKAQPRSRLSSDFLHGPGHYIETVLLKQCNEMPV